MPHLGLGIGSLERVELLFRLEQRFGRRFPDQVMAEADTRADLARAVPVAQPAVRDRPAPTPALARAGEAVALMLRTEEAFCARECRSSSSRRGRSRKAPDLLPLRLGAFKAAVEAGCPVFPVAILGTREILPAERWLPRRAPVIVSVGEPIRPEGQGWREIVRLRDLVPSRDRRAPGRGPRERSRPPRRRLTLARIIHERVMAPDRVSSYHARS